MIEILKMPYPIVSSEYPVVPIESCVCAACSLNHAALRDTANSVPPRSGIALK
jgi:hypothetical protein